MAEFAAKRDPNRCPTHPGELLRAERELAAEIKKIPTLKTAVA